MRVTLYIFIFIYILTAFRSVLPLLEYGFNYNYIANELCVNKAKPKSTCDGKCYLKKELSKTAEDHQEKKMPSKQKLNEIDFFYAYQLSVTSPIRFLLNVELNSINVERTLTGFLTTFSPPPLFS